MKLQGRDLSTEMRGADVALLQNELGQLGFTISAAETQQTIFGSDTRRSVMQFQQAHRLQATGVVDAQTAALINQEVDKLQPSPIQGDDGVENVASPSQYVISQASKLEASPCNELQTLKEAFYE